MFLLRLTTIRFTWFNLPTVSLLALLQRTPAVQLATTTEEFVLQSPVGMLLKSALAIGASLGTVHSLAGATSLAVSPTPSPLNATVGTAIAIQAMAVTGAQSTPASYTVSNAMVPGLTLTCGTSTITSATSLPVIVNGSTLALSGTPTTAGTYNINIKGWALANGKGDTSSTFTYKVVVTGTATSAPSFTTQPTSQTVTVGGSVTFTVAVSGSPTPTLQWRKDGSDLSGQTAATLTIASVVAGDAGTYTAVATNSAGTATSSGAVLTVGTVAAPATPASFGAYASGATEATASWLAPASGATVTGYKLERATNLSFTTGLTTFSLATTATSYVDTTVVAATTYYYRLSATNSGGASTATSTVQVTTPASNGAGTASFANIATRAYCTTNNGVTIGGFVISGNASKRVLVRAVGPSLTAQGLASSEVLLDPTIEVHSGNAIVATNDNVADNSNAAEITTVGTTVGATALLSSDTTSAALLVNLAPGVYSFVVNGKNSTSGIVLLEVYDADAVATGSTFANIATRAYCTTNNGVTIGGFVVSGSARKRVLMRAMGPTLATLGLGQSEVLVDPVIELHDAVNGNALIATNDNAGDNANAAEIVTTGARIGATAYTTTDTASSALLLTLRPGVYSFIARGKTAAPTGIMLLEVYDAD